MISLPKLLLEAAGQRASGLVIAVGERPAMDVGGVSTPFGDPVSESELFEALIGVLSPEQQAELAVGNNVEFRLGNQSSEWSLAVEPLLTGVVVRGRRGGEVNRPNDPEVGTPMDLPPLAPFEPEADAPPPDPVLKRRTQFDLGLKHYAEDNPPWAKPTEPPPPAMAPPLPDGKSPLPPPPPVGDLGPSRESGVDFAIVPDAEGDALDGVGHDEVRPAAEQPNPPTPAGGVPPSRSAPAPAAAPGPSRAASSATRSDLAPLSTSWIAGSVCFASDSGLGEQLAISCGAAVTILDEETTAGLTDRLLRELDAGGTYLVRLEDPSRVAPWILRRLEEGARVVVETRARTLAGAKRIFAGMHGEAALGWLAAHPLLWLVDDQDVWRIETEEELEAKRARGNGDNSDKGSHAPSRAASLRPPAV